MATLRDVIPSEVLAAMVEESLRKQLVFGSVANTTYAGVIANAGDSVSIPVIGDVTVSDYTKNQSISYQTLDATSQLLKVDQQKYFAFSVDDIDTKQSIINVASLYADRAGYQLRETADSYLAGIMAANAGLSGSGSAYNLGTTSVPLSVTAADSATGYMGIYELMSNLAVALDISNVPQEGRWAIVSPWVHQKMVLAGILQYQNGDQNAYANGKVGKVMGFDVRVSINCPNYNTTGTKIFAGTNMATSFVDQILNVETLRLETTYGDGVRGLYVYGGKVVQEKALAVAVVSQASG